MQSPMQSLYLGQVGRPYEVAVMGITSNIIPQCPFTTSGLSPVLHLQPNFRSSAANTRLQNGRSGCSRGLFGTRRPNPPTEILEKLPPTTSRRSRTPHSRRKIPKFLQRLPATPHPGLRPRTQRKMGRTTPPPPSPAPDAARRHLRLALLQLPSSALLRPPPTTLSPRLQTTPPRPPEMYPCRRCPETPPWCLETPRHARPRPHPPPHHHPAYLRSRCYPR